MLPKIDVPMYDLVLPLSKKKVKFRPFLVKEEKILLMAMESDDDKASLLSIKQILNNCCLSDDVDIETLPIVDLEFFFLNLRARSVSEMVELQYKCNNKIKEEDGSEKDCNHIVPIEINVLDINPKLPENHTNKVALTDKLGVIMKYPTISSIENTNSDSGEVDLLMNILHDSIESVYDEENIYHTKDVSKEELTEFIEGLTKDQFSKIQQFFDSIPKIKKDVEFKCSKCGYEEKIAIEGMQNFFV